jgi:hypothetical protein
MVRPVLSRRSCATMVSCHAVKRTDSEAASAVPSLEPRLAYGLISDPPFLWHTDAPQVPSTPYPDRYREACPTRASRSSIACARSTGRWSALAGCERSDQCDWMPTLRSDRRDGRCRCREASTRPALTTPRDSRCGSRFRHRRDQGRRRAGKLGKRHMNTFVRAAGVTYSPADDRTRPSREQFAIRPNCRPNRVFAQHGPFTSSERFRFVTFAARRLVAS